MLGGRDVGRKRCTPLGFVVARLVALRSLAACLRASAAVYAFALALLAASAAHADRTPGLRSFGRTDPFLPLRLDAHAALDWEGRLGVGGRADVPLLSGAGLRYSTRDELTLSLGCDVVFIAFNGSTDVKTYPNFAFQWSLGVTERWFFYPELGVSTRIDGDGWNGVSANLGFGARYYLQRSFALFGRFGWPIALSAGTTF